MTTIIPETRRPQKVDIALIAFGLTLFLQVVSAVWWASKMDQRMTTIETTVAEHNKPLDLMVATVARLDERSQAQGKTIDQISEALGKSRR